MARLSRQRDAMDDMGRGRGTAGRPDGYRVSPGNRRADRERSRDA